MLSLMRLSTTIGDNMNWTQEEAGFWKLTQKRCWAQVLEIGNGFSFQVFTTDNARISGGRDESLEGAQSRAEAQLI